MELVVYQIELQRRRLVIAEMILIKIDDRSARAIIEQFVGVERGDDVVI